MKGCDSPPDLVVVIGMYRSGAGAVARALATLGCTLGDALFEGNSSGDTGTWEDVDVSRLNRRLLKEAGSDWWRCVPSPLGYLDAATEAERRREARDLLAGKIVSGRPFALKDPRVTILLPFWQSVFVDLGLKVHYVHVFCDPFSASRSLETREQFSREHGLLLWLLYTIAAVRHTRGEHCVVVDFDAFLTQPEAQLARLASALSLAPFDGAATDSRYYLSQFLHQRADGKPEDPRGKAPLPLMWRRVYAYLTACGRDQDALAPLAKFDREWPALQIHHRLVEDLERRWSEAVKQGGSNDAIARHGCDTKPLARAGKGTGAHFAEAPKSHSEPAGVTLQTSALSARQIRSRRWHPVRIVWQHLPLSMTARGHIKWNLLFFRRTHLPAKVPALPIHPRRGALPLPLPVRMIAFYMPENSGLAVEGEPFRKDAITPPDGPREVVDPAILLHQAEQARRYGVEGFCFHFYWSDGERQWEQPLLTLLDHPNWNVRFCLCWFNEKRAGTVSGAGDALSATAVFDKDDSAFIIYIERYLRDARYIRVDGKPLILVHRPELLQDAAASITQWRAHCRASGLGEICVAFTDLYGVRNPAEYGMDAVVEFATAGGLGAAVGERTTVHAQSEGDGAVEVLGAGGGNAPYTFRGLNPGDCHNPHHRQNTAQAIICDPVFYQRRATAVCDNAIARNGTPDERLIFINAWNAREHAGRLEPDVRSGYAYLEATYMAALNSAIKNGVLPAKSDRIAVAVHAFYPDVLAEILSYIGKLPRDMVDLWVTVPPHCHTEVADMLMTIAHRVYLVVTPNRGRDVLPFMEVLPRIMARDYGFVLKIHTKKSPHRIDGASWRGGFYKELLSHENLVRWLREMREDRAIGMIAPRKFVVPMRLFLGANGEQMVWLAQRLGVSQSALTKVQFVAGTMFFCRWQALLPLWALDFRKEDFQEESGQLDGTLAHAVERLFGVACHAMGLQVQGC